VVVALEHGQRAGAERTMVEEGDRRAEEELAP
jgi:hypothetical protein